MHHLYLRLAMYGVCVYVWCDRKPDEDRGDEQDYESSLSKATGGDERSDKPSSQLNKVCI